MRGEERRRRKKRANRRSPEARPLVPSPYEKLSTKLGAVIFICVGVAMTYQLAPGAADGGTGFFLLVMGIGPIAAGAWVLYRGSRSDRAAAQVGTPRVHIDPEDARIGDRIAVVVELEPLRAVTVERVRIELVGRDDFPADWHGGEDRNEGREHELHRETRDLPGRQLRAGKRATFDASLPAPKVWASVGATASWKIRVQVVYADCPDWDGEYPINVEAPPDA